MENFVGNILVEKWWKIVGEKYYPPQILNILGENEPIHAEAFSQRLLTCLMNTVQHTRFQNKHEKAFHNGLEELPGLRCFFYVFMASLVSECDSKIFCWDRKEKSAISYIFQRFPGFLALKARKSRHFLHRDKSA